MLLGPPPAPQTSEIEPDRNDLGSSVAHRGEHFAQFVEVLVQSRWK
jgi:hypothetical protein